MRFTSMALVAAISFTVPAVAQTDAVAAKPAKEKKICRRAGPATGSIMPSPAICHTKADWDKIDSANENSAQNALDRDRALRNSGVGNLRTGGQ
jgi:hypothetical protein